jgi:hypothetical protein
MCEQGFEQNSEHLLKNAMEARVAYGDMLYRLALFLILLGIAAFASAFAVPSRWYVGATLSGIVCMVFVLVRPVDRYAYLAFDYMNDLQSLLRRHHFDAENRLRDISAFVAQFRPSQEQVDSVLREAALKLKAACQDESDLYRTGMGYDASESDDPEAEAERLGPIIHFGLAEAKGRVKTTKDEFWRLHALAESQGYQLKNSWKPYASLPWKDPEAGGLEYQC